jgi:hypothetical protein
MTRSASRYTSRRLSVVPSLGVTQPGQTASPKSYERRNPTGRSPVPGSCRARPRVRPDP